MRNFSQISRPVMLRSALLCFGVLMVAGCQTDPRHTASINTPSSVQQRHPIYLETSQNTLEIETGTNTHLDSAQATKVDAFTSAYRREGERAVYLLAPSGGQNDAVATALVAPIRHRLISAGVSPSKIIYQTYDATGLGAAPIRLSYETLEAKAGPCGMWPEDMNKTSKNTDWHNFGCAGQNNLAQMVVNKQDLITQRQTDVADTARRVEVLGKYRTGENTAADTTVSSAALSDVSAK